MAKSKKATGGQPEIMIGSHTYVFNRPNGGTLTFRADTVKVTEGGAVVGLNGNDVVAFVSPDAYTLGFKQS